MIRRLIPLIAAAGLLVSAVGAAQPEDDLQDLRRKIDSLKQELQANEATRHDAADALKSSEQAISAANRAVAQLNREQQLSEAALANISQDIVKTRQNLESNRQRLQDLIRSRHRNGQHEALRLLLNQQDPNKLARDLRYYRYIAQAQYKLSGELNGQLDKLNALAEVIRQKHEVLVRIAAERKQARDRLKAEQAEKQEVLSKIAGEIGEQRKQISKLQRDEKRLTQLVEKINRMIREREIKEAREREKQAKAQKLAEAREAARAAREAKSGKKPSEAAAKPEPVVKQNDALPDSTADGRRFAELKGELRLPARGEVTGKFGTPRSEGTQWKGVFIRTSGGQPVKAVASGRVVFADWLRGFGNMLIVDHGGGYLSLYGAAESLIKQIGDKVTAGEDIATSGNSGGSEQTGIYFEIRHLGKPLDPLAWAK
ncbi:murein hydrolase activator EnvC family protein [Chitinimonas sp. BJB300]|uniref:murein hydrolase activator EnvC family protein n=1 Tax=Chitinimonas sp. BJB300 TaxID=1559339 RepID=UPI000C118CBE|nr:peptidoglycan DD-metalloendopeptidase family protein [Chitinimonas sp. BJB300]PHV11669.1 peptidase M23 [Chitinimonas sp. BJB300]TSJ85922.1 peptidoglycan DD-metalloendopeptidase family protein [Chitinimonas sp. BJB300]